MEAVKKYLYDREEIIFAYLYGSLARGNENKLSDIDIALYIDTDNIPASGSFGYRSEIISELQSLIKREVDLIILNDVSLYLAFNVLKDGKLLFTKSAKERTVFHNSIMREYLDLKAMYRVQEDYLQKRLTKGQFGR